MAVAEEVLELAVVADVDLSSLGLAEGALDDYLVDGRVVPGFSSLDIKTRRDMRYAPRESMRVQLPKLHGHELVYTEFPPFGAHPGDRSADLSIEAKT